MSSKLPPLDFKKENKKLKAYNERKEINFTKCDHKNVEFRDGELVCPCGASWHGPRLQELFDLLTRKK